MDTDCTGNAVHKCCPEHNSGLNVCVKPVPGRLICSKKVKIIAYEIGVNDE